MSKIELELEINPFLNASEFNRIISAIKSSLGDNIKIKPVDASAFKSATKEAENFNEETKEAKENVEDVTKEAEKLPTVFESMKGALKESLNFDSIMNFTAGGLATSAISTGVSIITENFADAINAGNEFNNALLDMQAKTGATAEEMQILEEASIKAFEGGVGESLADAVKIIGEAKNRLGDTFSGNELADFTKKANALGSAYDLDVNEVIKKSESFVKQFGLGGEEAFNLIAYAQKEGKTASDDILDSLAEYSQLASQAGYSAQDFTEILVSGAKEGIFNTDKLADSIKEAEIRIKAGDYTNAFKGINESATKAEKAIIAPIQAIVDAGNKGELTIQETLQKSTKLIDDAFKGGKISESLASQLQVAIAGTPAEDIGTELFGKIFSAPLDKNGIDKKAKEVGENLSNAVGQYTTFDATSKKITSVVTQISGTLVSGFDKVVKFIGELLNSTLFTYWIEIFNSVKNAVNPLIDEVSALATEIGNLFKSSGEGIDIFKVLQDTFKFLGQVVGTVVSIALQPMLLSIRAIVGVYRLFYGAVQITVDYLKNLANSGGTVSKIFASVKNVFGEISEFVLKAGKSLYSFMETLGLVSSKTKSNKIEPQFDDKKLQSFREKVRQLNADSSKLTQEEIKQRQDAIANEINSEVAKKTIQSNNAETLKKQLFQIGVIQKNNTENSKKEVEDKRTAYQIAKENYDLLNKQNQRSIETQKIELETQRAKENTTLTIEDELLLNNLILNEQKRQLTEAEKLLKVKKKDNKETEDAKNIYEDLKKSILSTELNDIKIKAKLELEKTEIQNLQKQVNRNTLETEVKLKLKAESTLIEDDIRNLNEVILGLETELNKAKVGINTKAQAEINLKLTESQNQLRLKQLELEDKKETERLNLIVDSDLKIKESQLSALNKNYKDQLQLVGNNSDERIKLELKFQTEKQKIEDEYLDKTKDKYTKTAEGLASGFKNVLSTMSLADYGLNEEAQNSARETLKNIEDEEKELRKSFARRTIDKKEFYEKLADLDEQRKEQDKIIADNSFNLWKGITKSISDSLSQQRDLFLKYFADNLKDYSTYQNSLFEINKDIAEKEIELSTAQADGNIEAETILTEQIIKLTEQKAEKVEESNKIMAKAYEDLAIATGFTFGKMLADGDSFKKAFVMSSLGALKALAPILVAEIIGKEFATKSLLGIATSAILTGLLYAGLSKAEAAASKFRIGGQFGSLAEAREKGGGLLNGRNRFEYVNYNEDGSEFFVNHIATARNLKHLNEINSKNLRIEDYAIKLPEVREKILSGIKPTQHITVVNNNITNNAEMKLLIKEVQELKELNRSNHRKVVVSNELDVKMKFDENKFINDTNIKIRKNIRR